MMENLENLENLEEEKAMVRSAPDGSDNDDKFPPNITSDIFPPGVNVAGGNLLMMIKYDYEQ